MPIINKEKALQHYTWGEDCIAWVFVDTDELSVKQERMPQHTAEALHYHEKAQQFFFILKGIATFEVEGKESIVKANEGFYIDPGIKHRIINNSSEDLEFILGSQPSTNKDRFNCN
jgi:mannose-6-phosphate isomerase-like protein (cupin superfamily)